MNEGLLGLPQHERQRPIMAEDLFLKDGKTPLWFVFVEKPGVPVLSQEEADKAKSRLSSLFNEVPERVSACRNLDLVQARQEIARIEQVLDAQSQ